MVAPLVAAAARTAASQAAKKAATKPPRAKTAADERYNERRRAKRAADRLAKQAKRQSGVARQETLQREAELRDIIKGSYKDSQKGYKQSLSDFRQSIQKSVEYEKKQRETLKPRTLAENTRLTNMRKAEFRKARLTDTQRVTSEAGGNPQLTSEQRLARAEANFFYSQTRELWIGGSEAMRDQNIIAQMQEYGLTLENGRSIENLEDAFQYVKEKTTQKFPTLENIDEFDVNEQETKSDSPRPISLKEWRSWRASVR